MDLDQAILSHSKWKARLKNHLRGQEQMEPESVGKDDQCELGKWLYGEGSSYANLSAFTDVKEKHQKFHTAAAAVIRSARSCPPGKALELIEPLKSEFAHASSDCIRALIALKAAIDR